MLALAVFVIDTWRALLDGGDAVLQVLPTTDDRHQNGFRTAVWSHAGAVRAAIEETRNLLSGHVAIP